MKSNFFLFLVIVSSIFFIASPSLSSSSSSATTSSLSVSILGDFNSLKIIDVKIGDKVEREDVVTCTSSTIKLFSLLERNATNQLAAKYKKEINIESVSINQYSVIQIPDERMSFQNSIDTELKEFIRPFFNHAKLQDSNTNLQDESVKRLLKFDYVREEKSINPRFLTIAKMDKFFYCVFETEENNATANFVVNVDMEVVHNSLSSSSASSSASDCMAEESIAAPEDRFEGQEDEDDDGY